MSARYADILKRVTEGAEVCAAHLGDERCVCVDRRVAAVLDVTECCCSVTVEQMAEISR